MLTNYTYEKWSYIGGHLYFYIINNKLKYIRSFRLISETVESIFNTILRLHLEASFLMIDTGCVKIVLDRMGIDDERQKRA